ncbi:MULTISPECIES: sugar ABC transporter permease [unclassified Paenibacillus]|uniref:ABC transporter permease n=1 Tax=unclassified Paenibacillus TaxID=185978 RepID=UPI00278B68F1|nr:MULTISPECIES: ABC transporter permease subunit [unclassified Paenibacillus]MDQ0900904.1 putative aldouronate transport system permease protein [Paenibacillus sp. V4I7]MDQ0920598.1 putative aldouronate transport system permease protein [Paenibacillus sp. V4I5]
MSVANKAVLQTPLLRHVRKEWKLYSFLLIPVIYFIIFKYVPMLGNVIAFRKYRGGTNLFGTEWVGLSYFTMFMKDPSFWRAFRNDLFLSVLYLVIRFPLTLIFALLLNELVRIRIKKFVQTVSYLPHFISMVIVAGMTKELLSMSGPINTLLANLGFEKIAFISLPQWFPTIYVTSGIWQGLGWGTILYLAAMTSINTDLYEAAKVDGANRLRLAWHVTIPGILPTIMTLLILDIGSILGANFEKILLLYNPLTYESADVISTYVYRMGITGGNFSYATAVGLFEGVIGLILVTSANYISKKTTNSGLW